MDYLFKIFTKELIITLGIKFISIVILLILWPKIIALFHKILEKMARTAKLDELLVSFISSLITVIMYISLFYIFIAILGFKATSLITLLGTAGIAVGLALQGSLSNLAGGVLILFFKPFKKGDGILYDGIEGEVLNIQMIYTRIKTYDNQVVIIPNGQLANSPITNFSVNSERRLTLYFNAAYTNDIKKVISLLNEVANSETKILKDKPVLIRLNNHKDSSLEYIFRVWTLRTDYFDVSYSIKEKVREIFLENGIEIPYTKIDIYKK